MRKDLKWNEKPSKKHCESYSCDFRYEVGDIVLLENGNCVQIDIDKKIYYLEVGKTFVKRPNISSITGRIFKEIKDICNDEKIYCEEISNSLDDLKHRLIGITAVNSESLLINSGEYIIVKEDISYVRYCRNEEAKHKDSQYLTILPIIDNKIVDLDYVLKFNNAGSNMVQEYQCRPDILREDVKMAELYNIKVEREKLNKRLALLEL